MSRSERKLDWPAVRTKLEARGLVLPATALPFWFGNDARMASELGQLVAAGTKRATAGLVWAWEAVGVRVPPADQVFVVLDWEGEAIAVIRLTQVDVCEFQQVDAPFAALEGEGDGSLAWWRKDHWRYFCAECEELCKTPSPQMEVACLSFERLWPSTEEIG